MAFHEGWCAVFAQNCEPHASKVLNVTHATRNFACCEREVLIGWENINSSRPPVSSLDGLNSKELQGQMPRPASLIASIMEDPQGRVLLKLWNDCRACGWWDAFEFISS